MKNLIMVPIRDVHPYPNNPRMNRDAVDKVAASLQAFGFRQPIVVDKDYVIIAGHTRLEAAKRLRYKEVPVLVADDLTEEQVKAYRLADNKTAEFSLWDMEKLGDELADIADIDMEAFGFDLSEFEEPPEVVEDDFEPDPPKDPMAKHGDIYQLGRHRLMCGDSTSIDDVIRLVNGRQIDMLLTDPPYNTDYEEKNSALRRIDKRRARTDDGFIQNDKMSDEEFEKFLQSAFLCANSVMKTGGTFHIWFSDRAVVQFRRAMRQSGLQYRQQLIWVKNNHVIGLQDFQRIYEPVIAGDNIDDDEMADRGYEPCLYGWKNGAGHIWMKKRRERDVLYFDRPVASADHPTMKPILLFDYEMQCNTRKGDAVLDLFSGSGTTLMAAEQNGRIAYLMELDPKYVDVIIKRWETFTGEKAVLLNGGDDHAKDGQTTD